LLSTLSRPTRQGPRGPARIVQYRATQGHYSQPSPIFLCGKDHAGKTAVRTLTICNAAERDLALNRLPQGTNRRRGKEAGATKERVMKRTFALLTSAAIALGSLAVTSSANATVRHFGQGRYYGAVPVVPRFRESPVMRGFRESPTYAPDHPTPRG